MSCAQLSSERGCKAQSLDAPYCLHADWWKSSSYKPDERISHSGYIQRKQRYRTHKIVKQWSMVILSSGVVGKSHIVELEEEFRRLVKQWEHETSFHSSLGEVFTNEAYQRIMAMGRDALPWIFSELQRKPRHWFYALEKIVGHDVAAGAENFGKARAVWLKWAHDENYI
jgi:hypothetical protein